VNGRLACGSMVGFILFQRLSEKGWSWGYGPGAGVPASAGVCRNRLKPGLLGRCPLSQGTPHAV